MKDSRMECDGYFPSSLNILKSESEDSLVSWHLHIVSPWKNYFVCVCVLRAGPGSWSWLRKN